MLTEKILPININTVNFADARFQNIMKERYVPLVRKHSFSGMCGIISALTL